MTGGGSQQTTTQQEAVANTSNVNAATTDSFTIDQNGLTGPEASQLLQDVSNAQQAGIAQSALSGTAAAVQGSGSSYTDLVYIIILLVVIALVFRGR
jgi:cobalamin biosynthesis Mg chelatase CobN